MAITKIDGQLVGLYASADSGATWKEIVCGTDQSLEGTRNSTSVATKCGTLKTKGPVGWSMSLSGVANTTPDGDQISADELVEYFQEGTDLLFKFAHADDETILYREGPGFFDGYTESYPAEGFVTFDGTIEIDGNLTLTPGS